MCVYVYVLAVTYANLYLAVPKGEPKVGGRGGGGKWEGGGRSYISHTFIQIQSTWRVNNTGSRPSFGEGGEEEEGGRGVGGGEIRNAVSSDAAGVSLSSPSR